MKSGLYIRLAAGNIRKNRKIYLPYIFDMRLYDSDFLYSCFSFKGSGSW